MPKLVIDQDLVDEIIRIRKNSGFETPASMDETHHVGIKLALIHAEISEALEEVRAGTPDNGSFYGGVGRRRYPNPGPHGHYGSRYLHRHPDESLGQRRAPLHAWGETRVIKIKKDVKMTRQDRKWFKAHMERRANETARERRRRAKKAKK